MPASHVYSLVDVKKVTTKERSRREYGSIEDLAFSIERYGLLHPIVVTRDLRLVAGERRLKAFQRLHKDQIPAHFLDQLDEFEVRAIELEENVQRLGMTWQEEAGAILDYHEHRLQKDQEWSLEMTADSLGLPLNRVQWGTKVMREIRAGNEELGKADNLSTAINTARRKMQREFDEEVEDFLTTSTAPTPATPTETPTPASSVRKFREALNDIYNVTFQQFCETNLPLEKRYNVMHCDFPYGININNSGQIAKGQWEDEWYDDPEDLYTELCDLLIDQRDALLATHAHVLFWYPSHKFTETVEKFSPYFTVNPVPLVWFKSDSTGLLPDARRGPRRVYETALLMTRGDRHVIAPVNNCVAQPANRAKAAHPSEKPLAVVLHFLRMLVDGHAIFLDPSCGSGTAVAAAELLGAKTVTGIEPHSDHARTSRGQLNRVRAGIVNK